MKKTPRPNKENNALMQDQTLLRRIILAIVVIQAIAFALLIANSMRQQNASHIASQQRYAHGQSILLGIALAPYLEPVDKNKIHESFAVLRDNQRLRYIGVYDSGYSLIASLGTPPALMQEVAGGIHTLDKLVDDTWIVEQPIKLNDKVLGIVQAGYTVSNPIVPAKQLGLQNTIIALLGLVLTVAVSALMMLPLERDLGRLQAGFRALQRGDWQHRVATSRILSPLAEAVNALAVKVHQDQNEFTYRNTLLVRETQTAKSLLREINAVFWEADPENKRFSSVSDNAEQLSGHALEKWLSDDFIERYIHPNDREWLQDFFSHPGNSSDGFSMELRLLNNTDEWRWLHLVSNVETRAQGPVLVGLLMDISEQKQNEARAAYLNDHDALTELSNRRRFQQRLQDQIAINQRANNSGALLYASLDNFRELNAVLSSSAGDDGLRHTVHCLRTVVSRDNFIARLDGDGFGIILAQADLDHAVNTSAQIVTQLRNEPFTHDGNRIFLSASIGIALFPEHGDSALSALSNAELAVARAKTQGGATYHVFDSEDRSADLWDNLHWRDRIHNGLKHDKLRLFFQPVVDFRSGTIRHYQSLVTMTDDNDTFIDCATFAYALEQAALSELADHWLLDQIGHLQSQRLDIGGPLPVAVALSRQFCKRPNAVDVIRQSLRYPGISPGAIIFKIPYAVAFENPSRIRRLMTDLKASGQLCGWDGAGQDLSALDELQDFPVNYIELHQSLVHNLLRGEVERALLRKIADFARSIEARIIAAQVENKKTTALLTEYGIGLGYGNMLAKPSPRFHTHTRVVIADNNNQ